MSSSTSRPIGLIILIVVLLGAISFYVFRDPGASNSTSLADTSEQGPVSCGWW